MWDTVLFKNKILSIQHYIIFYFTIFFAVVIAFFTVFGYVSEQNALREYEKIISKEIGSRIMTQLETFFEEAPRIVGINSELSRIGRLDTSDQTQLQQLFTSQLKHYHYLTYISFGNTAGEYIGVNRTPVNAHSEHIHLINALHSEGMRLNTFEISPKNTKGDLISYGDSYNVTVRPWYVHAQKEKILSWYPPYKHANHDSMGVGVSTLAYNQNGKHIGVFSADLALDKISNFLKTVDLRKNGIAFIAQTDGTLIATSSNMRLYTVKDSKFHRFSLSDCSDSRLRNVGSLLHTFENYNGNSFITQKEERYLYTQQLFKDSHGLSIIVGVILAEKDFTSGFEENLKIAGIVVVLFIGVGILLLIQFSRKLAQPIEELNTHTHHISEGNFNLRIHNDTSIQEINELASAFNTMSSKLKESFYLLITQSSFSTIGKTLASISHQYKTPLAHLSILTTSLEAYLFKTDNNDPLLQDITQNMRKSLLFMDETMKNFSDFYKNSNAKETLIIDNEINYIRNMLKERLQCLNLKLDISCDSQLSYVGYKNAFDNVLMILVENGLDIFEQRSIQNPEMLICVSHCENTITLSITDNGGGIEINPIESVFNTFISTKEKSSGLGLAMCKILVETKLNGTIKGYNTDKGACFTIVFRTV